jgi:hypothetical protein
LPFNSVEEAVAGSQEVESNYEVHVKAARAIGEEYFDSDKVLALLIHEASGT